MGFSSSNRRKLPYGVKAIGSFLPKLTAPLFDKFGFSIARLLVDWAAIMGPDLAEYTKPEQLKWQTAKGTGADQWNERGLRPEGVEGSRSAAILILRVSGPRAIEVQFKTAQIVERINSYFGYRAVSGIRILQAPVEPSRPREESHRGSSSSSEKAPLPPPLHASAVAEISDPALRDVLTRLGVAIGRP